VRPRPWNAKLGARGASLRVALLAWLASLVAMCATSAWAAPGNPSDAGASDGSAREVAAATDANAGPGDAIATGVSPLDASPPGEEAGPRERVSGSARANEAFDGLPLRRVVVTPAESPWSDIQVPTLSIPEGARFSQELTRQFIRQATDTGDFAEALAFAKAEGDGVALTVRVVPRKIVQDIVTDFGGANIAREDVLREADLARDQEVTGPAFMTFGERIKALFVRHGFPDAAAKITSIRGNDSKHIVLQISVKPGKPLVIERRVIETPRGNVEEAARILRTYGVDRGDIGDETVLDNADAQLQTKLRGAGFFEATVAHALARERGIPTLRVKVSLGQRSTPSFSGNDHYDSAVLLAALDLEQAGDHAPGQMADRIRAFYRVRGFLDAEVTFDERKRGTDRVLHFTIREEQRAFVRRRSYPCIDLKTLEPQELESAPKTSKAIGNEVNSFLEEELPGADFVRSPRPSGLDDTFGNAPSRGARATPVELDPNSTFSPDTYERAAAHLQELYRADGFLSAVVGPVQVVRARCSAKSPPGTCIPLPLPASKVDYCTFDGRGVPKPPVDPDATLACVPDPARGVRCAPDVGIILPIKLGPRTVLFDAAFAGVKALSPTTLLKETKLEFGRPLNPIRIEDARRLIVERYREEGYFYAAVRTRLDKSPDQSRARVTFEVIEGERVLVRAFIIRGSPNVDDTVIRKRLALEVGQPYRTSAVQRSRERIATLNTYSSVAIDLEDPFVPEKWKNVVVTLVERAPYYIDVQGGFSTAEGIRATGEGGFRNLFRSAIALVFGARVSYPLAAAPFGLFDETARQNFANLPEFTERTPARLTASLQFPETGLGPLFRGIIDGVFAHDLQRDYYVRQFAVVPALNFSPSRQVRVSLSQSFEYNTASVFRGDINALQRQFATLGRQDLLATLLVPEGRSFVSAQKLQFAWDRRDNSLNATQGTFYSLSAEHVDALGLEDDKTSGVGNRDGHFVRLLQTISGYLPIYKRLRFAAQLRVGVNFQLTDTSVTYPNRLFFLGGADSMRAWFPSTFIPQEDADLIEQDRDRTRTVPVPGPRGSVTIPDPERFTAQTRPVRGGNLMFNPRLELRIPVVSSLETAVFADIGNLWSDYRYPFQRGEFPMRVSLGTGARIETPVFPIVFDFGFNPWRRFYDDRSWAFNFAIGLF
jgi:outer membrane protein assembly factor BamA